MTTSAGRLRDILQNNPVFCKECAHLRVLYSERVKETALAEVVYRNIPENSDYAKVTARRVAFRVRLECATARRLIEHMIEDHR